VRIRTIRERKVMKNRELRSEIERPILSVETATALRRRKSNSPRLQRRESKYSESIRRELTPENEARPDERMPVEIRSKENEYTRAARA